MKLLQNAFISAVICLLFGTAAAADLDQGFMAYRWGDDIWQHDELKELYNKGDIIFYSNPGEAYSLEGETIGDVIFGFYRGKLFAVYINIGTPEKYDLVARHMKAKYGLPDRKASEAEKLLTYKWKYEDVTIKLKRDEVDGSMKVAFYHGPTSAGLKQERTTQLEETSFRFFPIDKDERPRMVPLLEF